MRYLILFVFFIFSYAEADVVRRAAIDIGSGGTKLAIAEVDTESRQIMNVLFEKSYPVPYQASLDQSLDGTFDEETKQIGLDTFKKIKALLDEYEVDKTAAVATSAFRKANNARSYAESLENETGIAITIIPQREEGEIAFFSALSTGQFDENEVIVWDIGTGSQQISTKNPNGDLIVYMGENMGSVEFKSYIIDAIQEHEDEEDVSSPNPISEDENKLADRYARAFGRRAFPVIKEKIKEKAPIVGIGRLFYNSVRPIAAEDGVITRDGLRKFIRESLNKTDDELNNPFAHVDVSNCILTLAIMKAIHIQEIHPVETTTTKGLLVAPHYWDD